MGRSNKELKEAVILSIGDEILIGRTLDTNSNLIAKKLNDAGIVIKRISALSDNPKDIKQSFENAFADADIIISTGGLGPTEDDRTKDVLCELYNVKLILNEKVLNKIEYYLRLRGRKINKNNYRQALVPESATVLFNNLGSAPGLMFTNDNKVLIALPGVPFEMEELLLNSVIPILKDKYKLPEIKHEYISVSGIPEAFLAEKLSDWESKLPNFINLAYLPGAGIIYLRFSIYNKTPENEEVMSAEIEKLKNIIPEYIIEQSEKSIEELIGNILSETELKIATAESCTGGKIAARITSVPGSSKYYTGSAIAYDNSIKTNILKVDKSLIEMYGAVSSQVVEKMAQNILNLYNADFAVATSGIAGPDGGTDSKPVGTVWVGIAAKNNTYSRKFFFASTRKVTINFFSNMALVMLYKQIIKTISR
jgi:nicotinamide-nucleotide amidase